jgi:transposase
MKKNNIGRLQTVKQKHGRQREIANQQRLTIGLDLGDRYSHYCILDEQGEIMIQDRLVTSQAGLDVVFQHVPASRVALEAGTHSPWVSRHLGVLGHEVIVANPRNVAWITKSRNKNDRIDAEKLARMARVDVKLLAPIRHRGEQAQRDLALLRARAGLVEARTKLINSARGLVKSLGERLKSCESEQVNVELAESLSEATRPLVLPLLQAVARLSEQIQAYEQQIAAMAERYPCIDLLTMVHGVGDLTALLYVLTLEDPARFARSREVGAFLGLKPRQDQSGARDPQLRISKQGDRHLRWMLLQSAHCILRRGAPDSDLRRWVLGKLEQQAKPQAGHKGKNKNGKKRVLVALARRLAVLLHHLWVNGEVYDPLYQAKQASAAAA